MITVVVISSFAFISEYADQRVVIGAYQNEPIIFKDTDDQVKGIYVDIITDIAKKEGWQVEYRFGLLQKDLNSLNTKRSTC